ncbi:MAG: glutamyl-tRNA reductase [Taibaiella sp.]|nr:glutamyl-tRNA reductase [Taibaiella sp.]
MHHRLTNTPDFKVAGINYKKTDAAARGRFAINNEQYARILEKAPAQGLSDFFILSTCNRTEIYALSDNTDLLLELICSETEGTYEMFSQIAYFKSGWEAIDHLFCVSAGLDSQILGDYEILGQIKNAARFAKEHGVVCPFLERLVNSVLQSSKAVKTRTELSGGTVSVSFAAIQYIKKHVSQLADKHILIYGTGKIGRNTCRNLVDYLDTKNITLINRTDEKASQLATDLQLKYAPVSDLDVHIASADVILVATNAQDPTITELQLAGKGQKLVIDLSVPCNVAEEAKVLSGITCVNVDELSRVKDETLLKRKDEVPKAMAIIHEHISEFREWYEMRRHVPLLKVVKDKLHEINIKQQPEQDAAGEKIQKVINTLAVKVRHDNQPGCHYIQAINEFIG